ncbi:sugar ABC transporter permease [Paenibacillus spongiae]|uniref:Sugar ABC transporter permease n=2 Tax=Paenibacillus spongiae TaxID=2909671 RepID=A0ABY5SK17_9BACL|nr:sugar ABC transporter permease [Paenibacillus spongiae]UVI33785.1 sugar ABC transporter permease [Paenibacillus spongiae]
MTAKRYSRLEGMLFMAPWLLGFMIFMAFPLVFSLYMSFNNVKVLPTGMKYDWAGIQYYKSILMGSAEFYDQLIPYFQEVVIMIPVIVIFSLLIAIFLNQRLKGRFLFRAIFFLPVIFSTGAVLQQFMDQGESGLGFMNGELVGGFMDAYIGGTPWGKPVLAVLENFVLVLWYSGVQILVFLAGRQTIPATAYESARIDGASPWEVFWKITLPAMSPFILLNVMYTVVDMFTFPSNPIITMIGTGNYGYSSALAWIYFVIVLVFLVCVLLIYSRVNRQQRM